MQGKIDIFGMTDQGRVRQRNEDQFLVADLTKSLRLHQSSLSVDDNETLFGGSQGQLLIVADGLGGHSSGDRASQVAVQAITTYMLNTMPWFFRLDPSQDEDFREELVEALKQCETSMAVEETVHPNEKGMGTTLTMGYVIWPRMYLLHVGDSRCYRFRDGRLAQLTHDHTVKQQLLDAGINDEIEDDVAERWSNTLWNSIGAGCVASPDVSRVDLQLGDTLLFCTDGLTRHVDDDVLQNRLQSDLDAEHQCRSLIHEAINNGGSDNVTVIVARFLNRETALEAAAQTKAVPVSPDLKLSGDSTIDAPVSP